VNERVALCIIQDEFLSCLAIAWKLPPDLKDQIHVVLIFLLKWFAWSSTVTRFSNRFPNLKQKLNHEIYYECSIYYMAMELFNWQHSLLDIHKLQRSCRFNSKKIFEARIQVLKLFHVGAKLLMEDRKKRHRYLMIYCFKIGHINSNALRIVQAASLNWIALSC